ncbi:hypothetical protein CR513_42922, partial [Mucuna pruriens]
MKTKRTLSLEGMSIEEGIDSSVCSDTSTGIDAPMRRHPETQRYYQHHSRRICWWLEDGTCAPSITFTLAPTELLNNSHPSPSPTKTSLDRTSNKLIRW